MAKKGSNKALSVEQEDYIAKLYGGRRSPSSGGSITDDGDVRVTDSESLIECKFKGSPSHPLKSQPGLLKQFEKIADEAFSVGMEPVLQLRFYWPDSPLANRDGWVDLSVRRTVDDASRADVVARYHDYMMGDTDGY